MASPSISTGSSPQVRGGINSPLPFTRSAVYAAIRTVLDRSIPNSAGYFRAIEVVAPPHSVVNPDFPAACASRGITGFRVMDAVSGALAQAVPDRVPADGEGGNSIISIGADDEAGNAFVYVDMFSGARGAGPGYDGPSGVPHPGSNNANMPIEIAESTYPLHFKRYGIVEDSASPGRWRGSPALVREFVYLGADSLVQVRSDKREHLPFGLAGGAPGRASMTTVDHAGRRDGPAGDGAVADPRGRRVPSRAVERCGVGRPSRAGSRRRCCVTSGTA